MENPDIEESAKVFVGIQTEDTLVSVNGEPFTIDKFHDIAENFTPPVTYNLELSNPSGKKYIQISYSDPSNKAVVTTENGHHPPYKFVRLKDATALEVAIRHGIVGMDY